MIITKNITDREQYSNQVDLSQEPWNNHRIQNQQGFL